jgi:hypothetical protein
MPGIWMRKVVNGTGVDPGALNHVAALDSLYIEILEYTLTPFLPQRASLASPSYILVMTSLPRTRPPSFLSVLHCSPMLSNPYIP